MKLVIEVSGPKIKAGLIPTGYQPIWRVPDKDAYYCVPAEIAEAIRLHESWTEERAGFTQTLERLFEKESPDGGLRVRLKEAIEDNRKLGDPDAGKDA